MISWLDMIQRGQKPPLFICSRPGQPTFIVYSLNVSYVEIFLKGIYYQLMILHMRESGNTYCSDNSDVLYDKRESTSAAGILRLRHTLAVRRTAGQLNICPEVEWTRLCHVDSLRFCLEPQCIIIIGSVRIEAEYKQMIDSYLYRDRFGKCLAFLIILKSPVLRLPFEKMNQR